MQPRDNSTSTNLIKEISILLESHGVEHNIEGEWAVPYGKLPAIRALSYPRDKSTLIEVDVLLEDERILNECFAGFTTGEEGIRDGLDNFCINSFHVLLAAFWNKNDPNQVMTETWEIEGESYTAYIGNFGTRGSIETNPTIPDDLFPSIETAIKKEKAIPATTWFRHFFCDVSGEQTFEALMNNDSWENGLNNLKSLPWVKSEGYYSVRNFLILRAVA